MSFDSIIANGLTWVWKEYGKQLSEKAFGQAKKKWQKFKWQEAETKYRARLYEQHSYTRLLGNPKVISIEDIYVDAYVLDKPAAFRRFDFEELQALPLDREKLQLADRPDTKRKPALRIVLSNKRLFILGKPGSGKTTFLRFLTLKACVGKIDKTPIFVSLKEWSDSGLELLSFLVNQFEICDFPDGAQFITHLLQHGSALVLFDGLDEVNQEGDQRAKMIRALTEFSKRYPDTQICVTCRVAATDYSFDRFTYLEIADFDERQILLFVRKWYRGGDAKLKRFTDEFEKPENEGIRELAETPLLLTLMCLAFDETLTFPERKVDLYREALEALLKKWDASRGIKRDDIYQNLSPIRKEQLLSYLAIENFSVGAYFIREDTLSAQIAHYLRTLPSIDDKVLDAQPILKAMEAQHGILTERAHGIHSFSHLTFQEYFAARFIIDNAANGSLNDLVKQHLTDDRWYEVFLLTASMLGSADMFFEKFLAAVSRLVRADKRCVELLKQVDSIMRSNHQQDPVARALLLTVVIDWASADINNEDGDLDSDLEDNDSDDSFGVTELAQNYARGIVANLNRGKNAAAEAVAGLDTIDDSDTIVDLLGEFGIRLLGAGLEAALGYSDSKSIRKFPIAKTTFERMTKYLKANLLLVECLNLAAVSDRASIESRVLLPPSASAKS